LEIPVSITARHLALPASIEALIQERAHKLATFYGRMVRCQVTVEGPGRHHRSGGPYHVKIHLRVPGGELAVARQTGESLAAAVRDAFDAARRQIEDYARRQRGEVKVHRESAGGEALPA
jgi:ribosome-associated translation inhibitor RaiA